MPIYSLKYPCNWSNFKTFLVFTAPKPSATWACWILPEFIYSLYFGSWLLESIVAGCKGAPISFQSSVPQKCRFATGGNFKYHGRLFAYLCFLFNNLCKQSEYCDKKQKQRNKQWQIIKINQYLLYKKSISCFFYIIKYISIWNIWQTNLSA